MIYQKLENCIGQKLAYDVISENMLILAKGTIITEKYINRLKQFGIYCLCVEDKITNDIDITQPVSEKTLTESCEAIAEYDVDKTFDAANKLVKEIISNTETLENGFHILKAYDENTCTHSIAVAINALTIGIAMGLDIVKLNNLGVGAMLHDIGKSKVPIEILNKSGKLTPEERLIIEKHPEYGYEILSQDILIPATVKAVAYQHHENWNGTGYPRKLKEHEIYELAAIVHICDVYDAMVSKRTYKDAFSFRETVEYMKSQNGIMFHPYYLKYFLMYVPVYHTGTIVTLNDSSEAVVIKNHKGNMTQPTIRLLNSLRDIDLRDQNDLYIIS